MRPESARPGTVEQVLKTPRTARTARPITAASGRRVRLGTASMLTEPDGPFIETSRLNLPKYARAKTAKPLFEYLFYHQHDVERVRYILSHSCLLTVLKFCCSHTLLALLCRSHTDFACRCRATQISLGAKPMIKISCHLS